MCCKCALKPALFAAAHVSYAGSKKISFACPAITCSVCGWHPGPRLILEQARTENYKATRQICECERKKKKKKGHNLPAI